MLVKGVLKYKQHDNIRNMLQVIFLIPGARLTKAYDVTIQRYRNSHAKIENSKIHVLRCMG